MITSKEIKTWVMGVVGTLVTSLLIFAASTIYNVDKNVVGFGKQLEYIVKQLGDHNETLRDHEQRIRNLENKARTR